MSIDKIVNVSISNVTPQVTQAGFGVPLVLDFHANWPERFREYTEAADMLLPAEGFTVDDAAYQAVVSILRQTPRPKKVIVGRRLTAPIQQYTLQPTNTTVGYEYNFTFDSDPVTYTVLIADTPATIATAISGLITGLAGQFSSSVVMTDRVQITNSAAGEIDDFTYPVDGSIRLQNTTADAGVATDVNDLLLANEEWYAMMLTSRGQDEILAAATAIAASEKLLVAATPDFDATDSVSTTDVSFLNQVNGRSAIFWHHLALAFPEGAWMGALLPEDPGAATWANVPLDGVQPSPLAMLSNGQQTALDNKNTSYYIDCGAASTRGGRVGDGEWLDIVRGLDWLKARIQESVFSQLVAVKKIPYTEPGVALIRSKIFEPMLLGANRGLLVADTIQVTFPAVASISALDKGNRCLPDGKFSATLQGAVHKTTIRGEVSV